MASLSTVPGPAPGNQGEHAALWWAVVFLTLQSPQSRGFAGPSCGLAVSLCTSWQVFPQAQWFLGVVSMKSL